MKLHHLGIACRDIPDTLAELRRILPVTGHSETVHDPAQNADLCMVEVRDSAPVELIAGPMVEKIVRKGISLYHTCWEVPDIDAALAGYPPESVTVISESREAVLFGGRRVIFLSTPLGLLELLETGPDQPC